MMNGNYNDVRTSIRAMISLIEDHIIAEGWVDHSMGITKVPTFYKDAQRTANDAKRLLSMLDGMNQ